MRAIFPGGYLKARSSRLDLQTKKKARCNRKEEKRRKNDRVVEATLVLYLAIKSDKYGIDSQFGCLLQHYCGLKTGNANALFNFLNFIETAQSFCGDAEATRRGPIV